MRRFVLGTPFAAGGCVPRAVRARCFTNDGDGFTLVEVLVASGLVAIALASLVHLFAAATRANVEARDATYGTVLASQKLEELRAAPFPADVPGEQVDGLDSRGMPLDTTESPQVAYFRRVSIDALPANPGNAAVITVGVWSRGAAEATAVRLATIKTRKEP